ncbi:hypothetical protein PuT2_13990 [Pusillimonas sp. T2]|uniref:hypothetical protein n=1 Tax=Pusillimonas sp. T2 TaxID=1548123 RepID=UPI000B9D0CA1|nr:hypothetical protein [Pusillimonas sp. T2]OXR48131.1 hypothetical protein PuT2_13990 [Pusillimonas sp. T2]
MTREKVFVPRPACTVASGDCFVAGRCLSKCTPYLSNEDATNALAAALRLLGDLREYVLMFRTTTGYVEGSSIDIAVKESGKIIDKFKGKT